MANPGSLPANLRDGLLDTTHGDIRNTTLWTERWHELLRYPAHQWTRPAYKDELREHNKAMWVMFKIAYNSTPAPIETTLALSMHVARQCSHWNLNMTLSAILKKENGQFIITNQLRWTPQGRDPMVAYGKSATWKQYKTGNRDKRLLERAQGRI